MLKTVWACYCSVENIKIGVFFPVAGAGRGTVGSGDDVHEENGVLFWINRSGFPMDDRTWSRMWDHAAGNHPDGVAMTHPIRNQAHLPQVNDKQDYIDHLFPC